MLPVGSLLYYALLFEFPFGVPFGAEVVGKARRGASPTPTPAPGGYTPGPLYTGAGGRGRPNVRLAFRQYRLTVRSALRFQVAGDSGKVLFIL